MYMHQYISRTPRQLFHLDPNSSLDCLSYEEEWFPDQLMSQPKKSVKRPVEQPISQKQSMNYMAQRFGCSLKETPDYTVAIKNGGQLTIHTNGKLSCDLHDPYSKDTLLRFIRYLLLHNALPSRLIHAPDDSKSRGVYVELLKRAGISADALA